MASNGSISVFGRSHDFNSITELLPAAFAAQLIAVYNEMGRFKAENLLNGYLAANENVRDAFRAQLLVSQGGSRVTDMTYSAKEKRSRGIIGKKELQIMATQGRPAVPSYFSPEETAAEVHAHMRWSSYPAQLQRQNTRYQAASPKLYRADQYASA